MDLILLPAVIGVLSVLLAGYLGWKIKTLRVENDKANRIASYIHRGALTYLNKQYQILIVFVLVVASLLYLLYGIGFAAAFVLGALLSGISGNVGMRIATTANVRTTQACEKSITEGFKLAFSSGSVMSLTVVGLGVLGITLIYWLTGNVNLGFAFGFGASSIALFARVGGGIYTKAADVGADIAGKVEESIPEDDPRNPAVIADQVGDNVGDVAGMGADLFESYVDSIIAAMMLGGLVITSSDYPILFPLLVASAGILSSIISILIVRVRVGGKEIDPSKIMNMGVLFTGILMIIATYILVYWMNLPIGYFWSVIIGLIVGIGIGLSTEYYTSYDYNPVRHLAEVSESGAATNIIYGMALGMWSTLPPILLVSGGIYLSYCLGGLYGIALAAVGMLSTLGITLATDTYGPVADNAAGIAEMAGYPKKVRERAERLDAVGNTTAAIGKGFAIGSAALTAVALFVSYSQVSGLSKIDVLETSVVIGLFIGGALPFIFSSMALRAVGIAAAEMVEEVRRQFKTIKGLAKGKAEPDYERCVGISTHAALRQMVGPGLVAILTPILVWFVLGSEAVGGLLAGALVTGFLLAVFMANSGGAWDNAKKYVEKGMLGKGKGKGSEVHKATVIGDTVGDPFKDTAGPSLNILIKLMSIVALLLAMAH